MVVVDIFGGPREYVTIRWLCTAGGAVALNLCERVRYIQSAQNHIVSEYAWFILLRHGSAVHSHLRPKYPDYMSRRRVVMSTSKDCDWYADNVCHGSAFQASSGEDMWRKSLSNWSAK